MHQRTTLRLHVRHSPIAVLSPPFSTATPLIIATHSLSLSVVAAFELPNCPHSATHAPCTTLAHSQPRWRNIICPARPLRSGPPSILHRYTKPSTSCPALAPATAAGRALPSWLLKEMLPPCSVRTEPTELFLLQPPPTCNAHNIPRADPRPRF